MVSPIISESEVVNYMSKKSKDNRKKIRKVMQDAQKEMRQKKALSLLINSSTVDWRKSQAEMDTLLANI